MHLIRMHRQNSLVHVVQIKKVSKNTNVMLNIYDYVYVIQKTGDIELVFPATNITCHTKTLKQYSGFLTVKIPN